MLVIRRRLGERIVVDGGVEITVSALTRTGVRLIVKAPKGVTVLRGEVHDAVAAANAAASCVDTEALELAPPPQDSEQANASANRET